MQTNIINSKNREDYEILIRKRGNYEYSSYCPQLNIMVKGKEHDEVKDIMNEKINLHISSLPDIIIEKKPIVVDIPEIPEPIELSDETEGIEYDDEFDFDEEIELSDDMDLIDGMEDFQDDMNV